MAESESKSVAESDETAADSTSPAKTDAKSQGPGLLKRFKTPLLMLGLVVLQALMAYGVAQFLILPHLPGSAEAVDSVVADEAEAGALPERGSIVMMDDVVVNLQDAEGSRYLKVTAGLEYVDPKLEHEITARMPELRDLLIDHLSSQTVADVVHREGREVVKQQLLADFNSRLHEGKLISVYFSDFVVQ